MNPSREVAGFLCRWCLLALAGAMTAAAAWMGLLATVAIVDDVRSDFAMGDKLTRWPAGNEKGTALGGAVVPPARGGGGETCLAVPAGQPATFVWGHLDKLEAVLRPDRPGRLDVAVRGLPYSHLAFRQDHACLLALPDERAVFLVDARLARSAGREQRGPWRACMDELAARAQVVLFHPGGPAEFIRCRREVRDLGLPEPMLWGGADTDPARVLAKAARGLARAPSTRMAVLTDDADLARRAAGLKFATHLLTASSPKAALPPGTVVHPSLQQFKNSLSGR